MPEITSVTSEALQATIRRLLPSQQGFGQDLQATNLITPIIDLTPTAEGSVLPTYLQTAIAFGSQTAFNVTNTSQTLTSTPGFYRLTGTVSQQTTGGSAGNAQIAINDGLGDKNVWSVQNVGTSTVTNYAVPFDLTLFIRAGDSLKVTCNQYGFISGSIRQVADVTGNLIQPSGFTFE